MYYVEWRQINDKGFDGFDFEVLNGYCFNRKATDLFGPDHMPPTQAIAALNTENSEMIRRPLLMNNPVISKSAYGRVADLVDVAIQPVEVEFSYSLKCPTSKCLADFIEIGQTTKDLFHALHERHPGENHEQFLEIIAFRRPQDYASEFDDLREIPMHYNPIDVPLKMSPSLVDRFGFVDYRGYFLRDDVFDALEDLFLDNVFLQ